MQTDHELRPGGTHFNFDERLGLGATWRLNQTAHLMSGARYMHISNADADGENHNRGADTMEFYLGLMFAL